jgi:hypothetical protein
MTTANLAVLDMVSRMSKKEEAVRHTRDEESAVFVVPHAGGAVLGVSCD